MRSSDPMRYKEIEDCFKMTLDIYQDLAESQPLEYEPKIAMTYYNFAIFCAHIKPGKAETLYSRAFNIAQKYRTTNADCARIYEQLNDMLED